MGYKSVSVDFLAVLICLGQDLSQLTLCCLGLIRSRVIMVDFVAVGSRYDMVDFVAVLVCWGIDLTRLTLMLSWSVGV